MLTREKSLDIRRSLKLLVLKEASMQSTFLSRTIGGLLCSIILVWGLGASTVPAAERPFYEGKTIRIFVPFGPGGGFDMLARFLGRRMSEYIPGKPKFVVQNMPGGGGVIAANFLYNVAKPDGLTIGIVHSNMAILEMKQVPGAKFKMGNFSWIGGIDLGPVVAAIKKDLPYRTIEDFRSSKNTLFFAASASGTTTTEYPLILKHYGKLNVKVIPGYRGLSSALGAIERGEANARSGSLPSLKRRSDVLRIVIGAQRAREVVPDIVVDSQIVTSREGRELINALQVPQQLGRGIAAPPGVPQERIEILRSAWAKLSQDPRFLKQVKKTLLVDPKDLNGVKKVRKVIAEVKALPGKTWDLLKALDKK